MLKRYGKLQQVQICALISNDQFERLERLRRVCYPETNRTRASFLRHIVNEYLRENMHYVYRGGRGKEETPPVAIGGTI